MKKLLIIPWIITAFWVTLGSPLLVLYIWKVLLSPWVILQMLTLPILVILFMGMPILSVLLHDAWWDWIFDIDSSLCGDEWDEGE